MISRRNHDLFGVNLSTHPAPTDNPCPSFVCCLTRSRFATAPCCSTLAQRSAAWTQFARKEIPDHWQAVTLWSAYDRAQLTQVGREGFEVPAGSAAERGMRALVVLKVAVPIPDTPSRATVPLVLNAYQMRKGYYV
jgi:hypothetical protein